MALGRNVEWNILVLEYHFLYIPGMLTTAEHAKEACPIPGRTRNDPTFPEQVDDYKYLYNALDDTG